MAVVLLIDDEPQMGSLVGMCLQRPGVDVVQASDLPSALDAAHRERPEVVLLDLALGRHDGMAMIPYLREDPLLADVPIVAFSVHDSRRGEALQRGASAFVSKPFRPAQLREVVQPHLV